MVLIFDAVSKEFNTLTSMKSIPNRHRSDRNGCGGCDGTPVADVPTHQFRAHPSHAPIAIGRGQTEHASKLIACSVWHNVAVFCSTSSGADFTWLFLNLDSTRTLNLTHHCREHFFPPEHTSNAEFGVVLSRSLCVFFTLDRQIYVWKNLKAGWEAQTIGSKTFWCSNPDVWPETMLVLAGNKSWPHGSRVPPCWPTLPCHWRTYEEYSSPASYLYSFPQLHLWPNAFGTQLERSRSVVQLILNNSINGNKKRL